MAFLAWGFFLGTQEKKNDVRGGLLCTFDVSNCKICFLFFLFGNEKHWESKHLDIRDNS